ncbi:hypothetical protein Bbelb_159440 [Branchiostoma belcheri]|nr:hypothetical protein Bbelb_159440 [Branchiostoma belcheri]
MRVQAAERDKERQEKERERQGEMEKMKWEAEEREKEKERERQMEMEKMKWEAEEREKERQEKEAERRHQLEMRRFGPDRGALEEMERARAKTPKLPPFVDGKDEVDAFLQRFERFAGSNGWREEVWASNLSALLTGKALEVYSRLSNEDAQDYDKVKVALLKRYNLTEDGFRNKFRQNKPDKGESPEQFLVRLTSYLDRWVELSKTTKDYESLRDLFVKEQFMDACPPDLAIHLSERNPDSLEARPTESTSFFTSTGGKAGQQATFIVAGVGKEVPSVAGHWEHPDVNPRRPGRRRSRWNHLCSRRCEKVPHRAGKDPCRPPELQGQCKGDTEPAAPCYGRTGRS